MVKHYCDLCHIFLSEEEIEFSLDMTGRVFCIKHLQIYIAEARKHKYVFNGRHYKKDESSGYIYTQ